MVKHTNRNIIVDILHDERFYIDELNENDYSPKDGVIIINQYGILFDGQHRVSILQKKYGKRHEVMVLKLVVNYTIKQKLLLLLKWIRMKLKHE